MATVPRHPPAYSAPLLLQLHRVALGGVNALAQSGASTSSSSGGAAGAAGGRRDDDGALGAAMVGFPSPRARGERLAKQTGQPQSRRPT